MRFGFLKGLDPERSPPTSSRRTPHLVRLDLEMRTNFDFAPYRRWTVGFDRLFDLPWVVNGIHFRRLS